MSEETKKEPEKKESELQQVNPKTFWSRLRVVFDEWKKGGKPWGGNQEGESVSSFFIMNGLPDEDNPYTRSRAMMHSLFEYELSETILAFTLETQTLHVLTSAAKLKLLEPLGSKDEDSDLKFNLIIKDKSDKTKNFTDIIAILSATKKQVGYLDKSKYKGPFPTKFLELAKTEGLELIDVMGGVCNVLALKDVAAQTLIKSASSYTSAVLRKHLLPQIEAIVDEEKKVSHSTLADEAEAVLSDPAKLKMEDKYSKDLIEPCYTPIIMSGGKYDLKPSAASNEEMLHYGIIIVEVGARYKFYCSNIARTYFINPTNDQKENYLFLTQVYQAVRMAMKPGAKIASAREAAEKLVKAKRPDLESNLTANCGFGIGLEFHENQYIITTKNQTKSFLPGMCFNLCVGFSGLKRQTPDAQDKRANEYALLLADTVRIADGANDGAEALTQAERKWEDVSYFIGKEGEEADPEEDQKADGDSERRTTRAKPVDSDEKAAEKARREHQKKLAEKHREEALRKYAKNNADRVTDKSVESDQGPVYKSLAEVPKRNRRDAIYVDTVNEAILVPIHDTLVPFRISTIKSVNKTDEANYTYLHINFLAPDQPRGLSSVNFADPQAHFVRELTFRCIGNTLSKANYDISELRKRIQNRQKEREAKASLVEQEDLIVNKAGAIAILKELSIKPNLTGRKNTGVLAAHTNGFRYTATNGVKVDIIYANIKAAFFQPAEESINVLLHFQLHNPIMLGKKKAKKTDHVQFYYEVISSSHDLETRMHDEDGLEEEQIERKNKQRWNEKFKAFVTKMEAYLPEKKGDSHAAHLEFDSPYRELAFQGVPNRATVELLPTVKALVALDDNPPFVLTLSEVEIAVFERVQFSLRNFDLVFVFKNFDRMPLRIDAIPAKSLEPIKQWLDSIEVLFYESPTNMLWRNVMKTIKADVEGFYEDGGWAFLTAGDSDGEGGGEEGEDEGEGDAKEETKQIAEGETEPAGENGTTDGAEAEASAEKKESKGGKKKRKKHDSDEDESDYNPTSGDDDSEEFDTASDEATGEDDDSDESGGASSGGEAGGEGDDEEGQDWDEMEKKAKDEDRKAAMEERIRDSEDRQNKPAKKKRKSDSGKPRDKSKSKPKSPNKTKPFGSKPGNKPAPKPGSAPTKPGTKASVSKPGVTTKPTAPAKPTSAKPVSSSAPSSKAATTKPGTTAPRPGTTAPKPGTAAKPASKPAVKPSQPKPAAPLVKNTAGSKPATKPAAKPATKPPSPAVEKPKS